MKHHFYIAILSLFLASACNDDDANQFEQLRALGKNYYPLNLGQQAIFQVDSIIYDDFDNSIDTIRFQRREEVVDQFIDGEGRTVFITELSIRANDSARWVIRKNFTQVKTARRVEVTEDNLTLVPLVFPIIENERWDANMLNTFPEASFQYKKLFNSFEINEQPYDSTVTVNQLDIVNLIERFFGQEVYAANVGRIYSKNIALSTELDGTIRSGFDATASLIEFRP